MKKRWTIFLTLAMLTVLILALSSSASAATEGVYTYSISDGAATITDCDTAVSGDLVIPDTLGGCPVTSIDKDAFRDCVNLTHVTIPEGVTSIGQSAFFGCEGMKSITIPKSMTSIGFLAFGLCNSMEEVYISDLEAWCRISFNTASGNPMSGHDAALYLNGELVEDLVFPEGFTEVGDSVFQGCGSLKSVTIPESVKSIGTTAFADCSNLEDVSLPEGLTVLGNSAFGGCSSLESITIPDGVERIDNRAFYQCYSLTNVTLPERLTSIGEQAFADCGSLKYFTIPETVTSLGMRAFRGCSGFGVIRFLGAPPSVDYNTFSYLSAIIVYPEEYADAWTSSMAAWDRQNMFFSYNLIGKSDAEEIWASGTCGENRTWQLTSDGELIFGGEGSFASYASAEEIPWNTYRKMIFSVTLPEDLDAVWPEMLSGTYITSVTIPEGVTEIGARAFAGCGSLTEICFAGAAPDSIDAEAFSGVRATAYYPEEQDGTVTWTLDKRDDYGGELTWQDYCTLGSVTNCPHENLTDRVVQPTCTVGSHTLYQCDCGFSYRTDLADDALGHDWDEGEVTQEPTATNEGVRTYHCSRCEETRTEPIPVLWENIYVDVAENAWYYRSVAFCSSRSLIAGTGNGKFSPDTSLDRSMLVTILYRYEGKPAVSGSSSFTDVPAGQWYSDAIAWAQENGIVAGITETTFGPFQPVTQEQMAAIFYRYAAKSGIDTNEQASLDGFADVGRVSNYAKDAISWCVAKGILSGSGGKLNPKDSATRAEFASILTRYITKVAEVG